MCPDAETQSQEWETEYCTVLYASTVLSPVTRGVLFQDECFVQQHSRIDPSFQVVDCVHHPLEQFMPNARCQHFRTSAKCAQHSLYWAKKAMDIIWQKALW